MSKVLFYVLSDGGDNAAVRFACRLVEKVYQQQRKLYLHCPDTALANQLNDDLWTFRQGSFIPHLPAKELEGEHDPTPIVIGSSDTPPAGFDDVLVNLSDEVPAFFSRFQRTLEIVTPVNRATARKRYKFYQDQGCKLETHNV